MTLRQLFQCFVIYLLVHNATATCHDFRKLRLIKAGNVDIANILATHKLPRGGGGDNDSTLTRQNATNTASKENTSSWFSKLQLSSRRNRNNDTTASTRKVDDVSDNSSKNATMSGSSSSPIVQTNESKRTGWFQQRQPWKNRSNSSTSISSVATSSKNTTKTTKRKRRGKRKKSNEAEVENHDTASTTSTPTTESSTTNSTSTAIETIESPTLDSNNNNTNVTTSPQSSQQQMVTPSANNNGVIVIGPGLAASSQQQQYYRGQPVIIRGTSPSTNINPVTGSGVTPNATNSLAIVLIELFSSLLGKAMYLWFFTWFTKLLAQQEEGIIMPTQNYVWERLNDRYSRDAVALQTVMREPPLGVSSKRWYRQHIRHVQTLSRRQSSPSNMITTPNLADTFTRTVVVVELAESGGSMSTINFKAMPDVVSFLLQQQRQHAFGTSKRTGNAMPLEIVFIVNSPGGEVSKYGLAAAQMRRLKNQSNITTTVCVDKYAASGGFMIASQADKLVAAPFAMVGSVGVIVEGLNFYELAKRYGVQPLVLKAGDSKNPLSQWGPVTRQDLAQEQKQIEKVHDAFKEFVTEGRPDIIAHAQQVMDGSVYLGMEAQGLGLIDIVMTTDEYIFDRIEAGDRVLRLHRSQQGRFDRPLRFSPLDVLPHLRSWLSSTLKYFANQNNSFKT